MRDVFAHTDKNLGLAAWIAVLGVTGAASLSLVLSRLGIDSDYAVLFAGAAFPFVGWFMSKAAKRQGRNPWLYGLASLLPPLAILAFLSLFSRDMEIRLAQLGSSRHDP